MRDLGILTFLIAIGMTACAPNIAMHVDRSAGSPSIHLATQQFQTSDGTILTLNHWLPEHPEAVVIGVHGMNDYSRTFEFLGPNLRARNIAVLAYDQRGFGRSPETGRWVGHQVLSDDLTDLIQATRATFPGKPIFVTGVSMGAAVSMLSIGEEDPPTIDGLIFVSPAVWGWRAMNPFYRFTLWSSAHIAPKRTLTGRRLNRRPSDNIEHLRKLSRDPLMIKHTRIESIYGLVTLMDKAQDQATNLKIPVFLLYGHNDEIIPRQPIERLATQLPQPKEVVAYEAGYHMLLRDQQREVVFEDISDWVFSDFP